MSSRVNRREFIGLGVVASVGLVGAKALAADAKAGTLTEKDILRDGQPTTIANYCENPEKSSKTCPDYKSKPGKCKTCMFYNKDNSETSYKGGKYARCQLLTDPKKAQFVAEGGYCSTFVPKA